MVSDRTKAVIICLVFLVTGAHALIDVFIHAMLAYGVKNLFDNVVAPMKKQILGGPTLLAFQALQKATPFATTSIFGERFDDAVLAAIGNIVNAAVTGIATGIENGVRAFVESFREGVRKGIGVATLLLTAFHRQFEILGVIASVLNLFSVRNTSIDITAGISKSRSLGEGRSLAMDFGHMGNLTDQTNPLADDPALRRFLGRYDDDQCLEQLFCTLYASHPSATTQEERSFMKIFNRFDKRGWKYVPGMKKAARFGSGQKMIQKCQKKYSNCHFPLLVRASFIYSLKQTFKTR